MVATIRRKEDLIRRRRQRRGEKRQIPSNNIGEEATTTHEIHDNDFANNEEDESLNRLDEELSGKVNAVLARQSTAKPMDQSEHELPSSPVDPDQLRDLTPAQLEQLGRTIASLRSELDQQTNQSRALATRSRAQDQLVQSAPYASILGVVILGMGMMAYLNGWQKIAER